MTLDRRRIRLAWLGIAFAASLVTRPAVPEAAAAPATALQPLLGRWAGAASLHDREFRLELDWLTALGGRFTRLEHRLHPTSPLGAPPVFEAVGYYRGLDSVSVHGEWFDTGGSQRPIHLRRSGVIWTSDWGTAETELGRTRYTLEGDSVLAVLDSVLARDGHWREFGRARLRRVGP